MTEYRINQKGFECTIQKKKIINIGFFFRKEIEIWQDCEFDEQGKPIKHLTLDSAKQAIEEILKPNIYHYIK
jgi:hypothetical protein